MTEGTNPESLVEDYDFDSGIETTMGSGEEATDTGGGIGSGDLGGILNSDPHKPIDEYSGVSFNFKDGSKYLERGIDKLTGWPAILDITLGIIMMVFGREVSEDTEEENEGEKSAEEINQELKQEARS